MDHAKANLIRRTTWSGRLALALAAALVAVIALGSTGPSGAAKVHGAIFDWARANPGAPIPVLVQSDGHSDALTEFIKAGGGTVHREYGIISAVEAEVSPSFVAALASRPDVTGVSLDAPVVSADKNSPGGSGDTSLNLAQLTADTRAMVDDNALPSNGNQGSGVGVAVVDTGITHLPELGPDTRFLADVAISASATSTNDTFGHGTHIAGIVGGTYGIDPQANFINVKVDDGSGQASMGDLIAGLQFVLDNKDKFNIRVVNLSLHSTVAQSYKTDPLCAAAETLWLNGIFVVAAAGNMGNDTDAVGHCPGNDPFVMTVGAVDDNGVVTPWSSFGVTQDGFTKPDLVAPGVNIISVMDPNSVLATSNPDSLVNGDYFRLSGTSMAAGVVSGVAAQVLERHPDWSPGGLKCTLSTTARAKSRLNPKFKVPSANHAKSKGNPSCNSDAGLTPSGLLIAAAASPPAGLLAFIAGAHDPAQAARSVGLDPANVAYVLGVSDLHHLKIKDVNWDAIRWDAIRWDAVRWDAIRWDAIRWDAVRWDAIRWDAIRWDAIRWDAIRWDAIRWDDIDWGKIRWDAINWDAIRWDAITWQGNDVKPDKEGGVDPGASK